MRTFKPLGVWQNLPAAKFLSFIAIASLLIGGSCTDAEITESEAAETCFTKEALETTPWIKDELAWFQQPKMGSLRVAVYRYKSDYYLAFENSFLSGPASHIFNCEGKNLGDLQIHYNDFYDNGDLMAVLLTGRY